MFSTNASQVSTAANYIEDVFSTYLYTGNDSTQTITNGIDLSGQGGLVWIKNRGAAENHLLFWQPLNSPWLSSNTTSAAGILGAGNVFTSSGFNLNASSSLLNANGNIYASWTFREQAKFFDVVTYSGSASTQNISHNLGSVPGCIIVKRTSGVGDWFVYHRVLGNGLYTKLNTTDAASAAFAPWNNTSPTSTQFTVLGGRTEVNAAGSTYVAYLFAHDAGGFGLTGNDNVISCGVYGGNGSATGPVVTLGYEPQWVMVKKMTGVGDWFVMDNTRGFDVAGICPLIANNADQEPQGPTANTPYVSLKATGFQVITTSGALNENNASYIYIAIRRGPMKVPTSGTSVFQPTLYNGNNGNNRLINTTIAPDMVWVRRRVSTTVGGMVVGDRLRGQPYLLTGTTAAEVNGASAFDAYIFDGTEYGSAFSSMNGYFCGSDGTAQLNTAFDSTIAEAFKRAPGFFDEVCYTGDGTNNRAVAHNLGVVPELIILKRRNGASDWNVGTNFTGSGYSNLALNLTGAANAATYPNNFYAQPTATNFYLANYTNINGSSNTFVAYLFATCPGVSKVGSYTGTGTALQIDCGFTGGARFVLIKRSDSTGDWYVWDSARGIVAGNDPYLLLNSTAAEVTNTDYVDTFAAGFEISSTAPAGINASGGSYIFLAIA